jgi:hypothetical protein
MYSLLKTSGYFDEYSNATVAALAAWASVITMGFKHWDRPAGRGHDWAVKKGKLNRGDLKDLVGKNRYETIMNEDLQFQYMAHLLADMDPVLKDKNFGLAEERAGYMVGWLRFPGSEWPSRPRATDLANLLYNCHANPNDDQRTTGDQCKALER